MSLGPEGGPFAGWEEAADLGRSICFPGSQLYVLQHMIVNLTEATRSDSALTLGTTTRYRRLRRGGQGKPDPKNRQLTTLTQPPTTTQKLTRVY